MPFIYVDVHLKTILAVTLFSIILWLVCQKMEFAARLSSCCEVLRFEVHEIFMRMPALLLNNWQTKSNNLLSSNLIGGKWRLSGNSGARGKSDD